MFAVIFFVLITAGNTSRPYVLDRMKQDGPNVSKRNYRTQNAFVVVELALALVLLAGAGLMVRSLAALWRIDPGFNPRHVLNFSLTLPPSIARPEAIRAMFRQVDSKLASTPGVNATA